jgi:hypothetical protein
MGSETSGHFREEESPAFAGNRTRSVVTLPTTLLRNCLMTACQPREFETRPDQLGVLLLARTTGAGRCNCNNSPAGTSSGLEVSLT